MPDPAVDAARLGLSYTEPTSPWTKKAKVRFVAVPDPYGGPPRQRRVIEADKGRFWKSLFASRSAGGKPSKHSLAQGLALPTPTPAAPKQSWWQPHTSDARPMPIPTPASSTPTPLPTSSTLAPSLFPPGFEDLPWHTKRHYRKMYKAELKAMAAWERSQLEAMRAAELEKYRVEKEARRVEKEQEKLARKQAKYALKYPYGDRQLPWIAPPGHNPQYPYAYPQTYPTTALIPPAAPAPTPPSVHGGPVDRWVMAPTLEEFGVRRPFNAPVEQKGLTIGGVEWPMMSRTMHHALVDLAREENLRRLQAGQKMPGMPGH